MRNIKLKEPIYSFTIKEFLDSRDGQFIHHDEYAKELESPVLEFAYANTLRFKIKSSKFGQKVKLKNGKTGTNQTWYKVYVLFEDFYTIGRDKEIPFEDAIDYAINYGDVHIRCNCPAAQFWGYNFIDTELKAIYGVPKEGRFPHIRNPQLKGVMCKHTDVVLQWIFRNKEIVAKMFATYYDRLKDGQSIYAVNTNGTTLTIGHKNDEGDVFFENDIQEENGMSEEEEIIDEKESEDSNVIETDDEWHIEDPTEGAVWDEE